jgi:endoglucanase
MKMALSILTVFLCISLIIAEKNTKKITKNNLPLISSKGETFVNNTTRAKILLKGVCVNNNCWGVYRWPESHELEKNNEYSLFPPKILPSEFLLDQDYETIKELGANVVRYEIAYETFSPDNPHRNKNLSDLKKIITNLESAGAYTLLCLTVHPGWHVPMDNQTERVKPGNKRVPSVFENRKIYMQWQQMWTFIARGVKDMDSCLGFELLNEPRLPARSDCPLEKAISLYTEICSEIRKVNSRHIIFIPEFNSREVNPGEKYWKMQNGKYVEVVDHGEQGISWEQITPSLPKSVKNIALVSHVYEPFGFTHEGDKDFDRKKLKSYIKSKIERAHKESRPLFISEYGVNYRQNLQKRVDNRVAWYREVHRLFSLYGISSSVFTYKHLITPWVSPYDLFGLKFQLHNYDSYLSVKNGKLKFTDPEAEKAALSNGMASIFHTYFTPEKEFDPISTAGNEKILNELKRYFGETN